MIKDRDIDIIVLGTVHRPLSVLACLSGIPHKILVNEDHLPANYDWPLYNDGILAKACRLGAFRCFRGHQEALKMVTKRYVLMLEDDAIPREGLKEVIQACKKLLRKKYQLVSLFSGDFSDGNPPDELVDGLRFFEPRFRENFGVKWATGSVAYFTTYGVAKAIAYDEFNGLPMDIYLHNRYKTCIIDAADGGFDHNDKAPSHFKILQPELEF